MNTTFDEPDWISESPTSSSSSRPSQFPDQDIMKRSFSTTKDGDDSELSNVAISPSNSSVMEGESVGGSGTGPAIQFQQAPPQLLKKRSSPVSSEGKGSQGARPVSPMARSLHRISFHDEEESSKEDLAADINVEEEHLESSNWKVKDSAISQVPLIYPLAASSCFAENSESLQVSARISHCLTSNSIAAMYDDSKGSAMATTDSGVGLNIRLFHGSGSYSKGIIVEVQHQSGDNMTFHRACQMLFDAAKGEPYSRAGKGTIAQQIRAPPPTLLKGKKYDDQQDQIDSALAKALELLNKDRIDAKKRGMEILIFLTDPVVENRDQHDPTTLHAAETILLGRDEVGEALNQKLFDLLHRASEAGETFGSRIYKGDDRDEVKILRPPALKVIRNALGVLSKATDIREVVSDLTIPPWLVDTLVPALVAEISTAVLFPGDAYVAAECLIALFELSDMSKQMAANMDAVRLLRVAHAHGKRYHVLLERAGKVALESLEAYLNTKSEATAAVAATKEE